VVMLFGDAISMALFILDGGLVPGAHVILLGDATLMAVFILDGGLDPFNGCECMVEILSGDATLIG